MTLEVAGLEPLPDGSTYTLWLTRDGSPAESCGAFVVASGTTRVPLNAPYPLKTFDGWVVVKSGTTGAVPAAHRHGLTASELRAIVTGVPDSSPESGVHSQYEDFARHVLTRVGRSTTAREPAPSASSATRCGSTSPTGSRS